MAALPSFISRRNLMLGAGLVAASAALPLPLRAATNNRFNIKAGETRLSVVGTNYPTTAVWAYNGTVPGEEIRVKQGSRLRVAFENRLKQESTIHWHGVRVPNAMDGVPNLTQPPVEPGGRFLYEFDVPDAGTFWYHPHARSNEQVERGLQGVLIVEEKKPIRVDRDITWVLDDWRLRRDAQVSPDFNNFHDMTHEGRTGNTVTINGKITETVPVRAGERIRIRLINTANARIFALQFDGHKPQIIALDGQPVTPHTPANNLIVLGPSMRADIVVDMQGKPSDRFRIIDRFFPQRAYRVTELAYSAARPLRENPLDAPIRLAPNPLSEPELSQAERHRVVFNGGMMGMMMGGGGMMGGPAQMREGMRDRMREGKVWFINGAATTKQNSPPFLSLKRGRSYIFQMENQTAFPHPIHFHGHAFRFLSRNGKPTAHREWLDTVLMMPRDTVEIAFAADNPGDWMFHCHIPEHQMAGMMGIIRVS